MVLARLPFSAGLRTQLKSGLFLAAPGECNNSGGICGGNGQALGAIDAHAQLMVIQEEAGESRGASRFATGRGLAKVLYVPG